MAKTVHHMVLEPNDEYPHAPGQATNYNESMYLNAFDLASETGGWFRLGNRVNEGYAEMTVCIYLPGGRVGFAYARPEISDNSKMEAGGLKIEVIAPFEHLVVTYRGKLCVLDTPEMMSDPRTAFRENPWVEADIHLEFRGISPMYGGRPVDAEGHDLEQDAEKSFAKAHYEQHCAAVGTIRVGDEVLDIDGLGLRDKSWGPRYWQAIQWYRWLPLVFNPDFAMMISVVQGRPGGMVLVGDEYHLITDCSIDTEYDARGYQTAMMCQVATEQHTYQVTGEVISLIPLRNRRHTPDGELLETRIVEAMTRYRCEGQIGIGMSEYLDQIEDGRAVHVD